MRGKVPSTSLDGSRIKLDQREGRWTWKLVRCVDCEKDFQIREAANQGFRYHRCAPCAAKLLEKRIRMGNAEPIRVYAQGDAPGHRGPEIRYRRPEVLH